MEIAPGQTAPEIVAEASNGKTVSLSDYKSSWIILYFYPRNDTPGCTKEACAFRDLQAKLTGLNAVVLGCSTDNLRSHDKFITKYDLPFTLLSDEDHKIAEAYGAWKEKNMYGRKIMGVERCTFLIDPAGKIDRVWRGVKVDGHVDEIIDELKMLAG